MQDASEQRHNGRNAYGVVDQLFQGLLNRGAPLSFLTGRLRRRGAKGHWGNGFAARACRRDVSHSPCYRLHHQRSSSRQSKIGHHSVRWILAWHGAAMPPVAAVPGTIHP
ncbi:hypothetical protein N7494_013180 [Penicillium frequentans]|uniref:Uncharacterized protein n=1 Tax=Penicillium frequentans TaxID=3151616 RepID=A0AAD6CHE0_9EURO|nr:hypothetical protein N7494_013180 [Penicillium glabrum]